MTCRTAAPGPSAVETSTSAAPTVSDTPLVSVVIPTYRRPLMLERCLGALLTQTLDPSGYEIIVCDDGPDEATRAVVERRQAECAPHGPRIRYVPVTHTQGPAGARNRGWRLAGAAIVAFTDDDTLPAPQWLAAGLEALAGGAAAACGRVEVPLTRARPTDYELDTAGLACAEFVTANCFVQRAVLQQLGGFDERYTCAWREDSDLQFKILESGGQVVRAPAALVVHPVRPARWGISLTQQKKSQFDALLYKLHRQCYREHVSAQPPWSYYATLACLLAALIAAATALWGTASLAALGWLALTARFTAKRLLRTALTPAHIAEMIWTSILIPPLSIFWRLVGAWRFKVFFL